MGLLSGEESGQIEKPPKDETRRYQFFTGMKSLLKIWTAEIKRKIR